MGAAVASVGDIDGDGFPDVLVGGPDGMDVYCLNLQAQQIATVYSGLTGQVIRRIQPPQLAGLNGSGEFGFSVAGPGDVDGDSVPDLLVGAPIAGTAQSEGEGAIYAISGATGGMLYSCFGATGEFLGAHLASGFDLDGDGVPDFVTTGAGFVRAFSGATGSVMWTSVGQPDEGYAASVLLVPDTNGDGRADVVVGSLGCAPDGRFGGMYILSGPTGALLHRIPPTVGCGDVALALTDDLDGDSAPDLAVGRPTGCQLCPGGVDLVSVRGDSLIASLPAPPGDLAFGSSLGSGDLDGNGTTDVVIGAPYTYSDPGLGSGSVSIWSAAASPPVFRQLGWARFLLLGGALAVIGDANGDGRNDVAVGAPGVQPAAGSLQSGGAAVFGLAEVHAASARVGSDGTTIHLGVGEDAVRATFEPSGSSFSLADVRANTVALRRLADLFQRARAVSVDTTASIDRDGNGVADFAVVFSRTDVRAMFPDLGATDLEDSLQLDATLRDGSRVEARLMAMIRPDADFRAAHVSPNPISGRASLTVFTTVAGILRVRLYDLQGRLVRTLVDERDVPPGYHDVAIESGAGNRADGEVGHLLPARGIGGRSAGPKGRVPPVAPAPRANPPLERAGAPG